VQPRVAIIYLCYGNLRHLSEVVSSWAEQEYPKDRTAIVMIPNGSPDGIADVIRSEVLPRAGKDLPNELVLLDNGENGGFAAGNNQGIRWAQDNGYDYVYLNNGDLKLDPHTISHVVDMAESDDNVGAVQSLVLFWDDHEKVNTTGGMIHIGGYGYARDNGRQLSEIDRKDGEEIMYPSGAATLYRVSALNKVGLLEEGFFMYHEDLELGLRLRIAGFKNLLSMKSRTFHDYQFSRNPKKFQWMETYRWVVMVAYLKPMSVLLWIPFAVFIELGSWAMSIKGGWVGSKWKSFCDINRVSTIKLIHKIKSRQRQVRVIKDRDWLRDVTGKIEDQETESTLMRVANAVIDPLWRLVRTVIFW
jgi:GT2 family glycosyltransferase